MEKPKFLHAVIIQVGELQNTRHRFIIQPLPKFLEQAVQIWFCPFKFVAKQSFNQSLSRVDGSAIAMIKESRLKIGPVCLRFAAQESILDDGESSFRKSSCKPHGTQ